MKTLIVIVHPNLKDSKVNKAWIKEAEKYPDKFPLLIKYLDVNDRLSIQVHPSDEVALNMIFSYRQLRTTT